MSDMKKRSDGGNPSDRSTLFGEGYQRYNTQETVFGFSTRRTICPLCESRRAYAATLADPSAGYCHACRRFVRSGQRHVRGRHRAPASKRLSPVLRPVERSTPRRVVATYGYRDELGQLLFLVDRLEYHVQESTLPGVWQRRKDFRQWHFDQRGGRVFNIRGIRRVLFCLPQVIAGVRSGATIVIVEGEKDAAALNRVFRRRIPARLVATTSPGGAGSWRPEYSEVLRGADVVVWGDNDERGREHAAQVIESIRDVASRVRLVALPADCHSKDAADLLRCKCGAELAINLIASAVEVGCE